MLISYSSRLQNYQPQQTRNKKQRQFEVLFRKLIKLIVDSKDSKRLKTYFILINIYGEIIFDSLRLKTQEWPDANFSFVKNTLAQIKKMSEALKLPGKHDKDMQIIFHEMKMLIKP